METNWLEIRSQVAFQVWGQTRGEIGVQVRNQIWDQVWGEIGVQVRNQAGKSKPGFVAWFRGKAGY